MDSSPGCYVSLKNRRAGQEVMVSSNGAAANWAARAASNEVRRGMAQARLIRFLLILIALLPLTVAAGESLTCGSRLVSEGDTKAEVFIKCGKPAWRDNWIDQVTGRGGPLEQRVTTEHERWVYNFGPNAFLRFLLFGGGRRGGGAAGGRGGGGGRAPRGGGGAGRGRGGRAQGE